MSSSNRARNRAIKKQMAETGTNFTRAAHAVPFRPSRPLRAVCFTCRENVPDGGGVIHIRHFDVREFERTVAAQDEQRKDRAAVDGRTDGLDIFTLADMLARPEQPHWQVHCDACNPHRRNGCEGCYSFGVERCRTWAQLVDWTVHLVEKGWVLESTNWTELVRATAHGTSDIGLVCHPADRYHDVAV
jgi:hypothetical protein